MSPLSTFEVLPLPHHLRHALDVIGPGEHVHGLEAVEAEAEEGEELEVPREGRGIAGDIDDLLRHERKHALRGLEGGACPGRVQDDGLSARSVDEVTAPPAC